MDQRVDQITIEAARRGDRTAQGVLLRQLQDPWFRMAMSLLGDAEAARDAVQETALRFLRDLPGFRGDSSILTWSMGIAINVTREIRRKSRPMMRIAADDDDGGTPMPAWTELPDVLVGDAESHALLRATLQDLPERQREAVILRFFQELSVEETAAAMKCAAGTVKATVHQALRALKSKLEALQ